MKNERKDLQELKRKVDLRCLVGEIGLLTKSSKTHCLWHEDNTPSLHIYPDGFFCFVCGASGDHLDWLMASQGLSIQQAIEMLSRYTSAPTMPRPRWLKADGLGLRVKPVAAKKHRVGYKN